MKKKNLEESKLKFGNDMKTYLKTKSIEELIIINEWTKEMILKSKIEPIYKYEVSDDNNELINDLINFANETKQKHQTKTK
mgnify:FL=1